MRDNAKPVPHLARVTEKKVQAQIKREKEAIEIKYQRDQALKEHMKENMQVKKIAEMLSNTLNSPTSDRNNTLPTPLV